MKVIRIRRNSRDIIQFAANKKMILIGRSPSCDVVLRAPGVKPVHFMLEWVGAGEFSLNSESQEWSVFDISSGREISESEVDTLKAGFGKIIGNDPVDLGNFQFQWSQDRLSATEIIKPIMGSSINLDPNSQSRIDESEKSVLEVIKLNHTSGAVEMVTHIHKPKYKKSFLLKSFLSGTRIQWGQDQDIEFDFSLLDGAEIYNHGIHQSDKKLKMDGLIEVRIDSTSFYFRIVNRVEVPKLPLEIKKDPYYRYIVFSVFALLLLLSVSYVFDFSGQDEPDPAPPRIARVEVKNVLAQTQELPKQDFETLEESVVSEVKDNLKEVVKPVEKKQIQKSVEKTKTSVKKENVQLKKAKQKNVNSVGLLGALGANKKGPKTKKIRADMILNDASSTETADSSEPKLNIKTSPKGFVGQDSKRAESPNPGLTGAASDLNLSDNLKEATISNVSTKSSDFSFNFGAATSDIEIGSEYKESIQGGLDKESVRRAIAAHRKEFRTCYEKALLTMPKISGRIVYKWQINANGPVDWIKTMKKTVRSQKLVNCVQSVIQKIVFPQAPNKQPTLVIYPFEFKSKN